MYDDQEILELRPEKHALETHRPYFFLNEFEPDTDGRLRSVNTIFLTNRECSFKCVMCDLWRHTLDEKTPVGAIPKQIGYALERLPPADEIKLYNNGNFFDRKAIPRADFPAISKLVSGYSNVILENHPKLCNHSILPFQEMLSGTMEIAMGLETIHPEVLPKLNKQVTMENFARAARFLHDHSINSRAFILLNPPFLTNREENIEWCLKSVEFAFSLGIHTCSIIPTRAGNGVMDKLQNEGEFVPPSLSAFEEVIDRAISMGTGRVFADIWDLKPFSKCDDCFEDRRRRLNTMNLEQKVLPRIKCNC